MTTKPSLFDLWKQAGGGTGTYDPQRYHDLLVEHGHLVSPGDEGYEDAAPGLPCGWPGKRTSEEQP